MNQSNHSYKWYLLGLAVLTNMLISAIPSMAMSVMAKDISDELGLTLTEIGVVWGIVALPGIFTGLLAGAAGDQLGPKRILVPACLVVGLLGAGRGLAVDFLSMTVIVFFGGALIPFCQMNTIKTIGMWFPPKQLGLANGVISMGMAAGFLIGSLTSDTLLVPLLGSWRYVFILYGVLGALMSIPWAFTRTHSPVHIPVAPAQYTSMRQTLGYVARLKNVWLLGLTLFGVGGGVQGLLGYLPLYLRSVGWTPLNADGALSAFHTISLICVLPIALWSDRLGSRKRLLLIAATAIVVGTGLLSFVDGFLVWGCVLLAGFVRDGFMAIYTTMVIETQGVGPHFAGTALGFAMGVGGIGRVIAPPLGNSLAVYQPAAPFAFWAACALFGMFCLVLVRAQIRSPEPALAPEG